MSTGPRVPQDDGLAGGRLSVVGKIEVVMGVWHEYPTRHDMSQWVVRGFDQGKGDKPVIFRVHIVMPDVPPDGFFHPDELGPVIGRAIDAEVETRARGLECPSYVRPL